MEKQVKRIGVLTSGGDAPGMNAAVRAVVRTAISQGVECVGIRRGWNGLINSDFTHMSATSVSHIINKGGTLLSAGMFGYYGPQDAHMPCIMVDGPEKGIKVVFKIRVK